MIDFRSDTFTKPTPAMLQCMFEARVGDDVFGEDPSVNSLENTAANMFGMQAALFCPSGTMTNQIAIKCHTQPGDEVICEKMSHVYIYEGGGIAFNSGCQVKAIEGDRGRIYPEQIINEINADDIHRPVTRLISLENTTNRGGGCCYQLTDLKNIREVCLHNNLRLHLDGARLFNALVALDETPEQYSNIFDSISICLSKGLGAPVGSVLLGTLEFINKARRVRKVFGGGMRQAGYLAAAGIYALEHQVKRLAVDHKHAGQIAEALLQKPFTGKMMPVETNIIIFEVIKPYSAKLFAEDLLRFGIRVMPISPTQIRMVLHLDVTDQMVTETLRVIETL